NPARCAVMSYDYTVFAGTQGAMNHKKTDRLLHVVRDLRLPLIVFAEGGGGRPGDTDVAAVAGLDLTTFRDYAGLSGVAPRIAIASGRCFAGNAALFGCSDITIATADATIGMGGPVMVKGGGLGNFRAEEIGPAARQAENGVVDVLVANEVEAVRTAKRALSYFQGALPNYRCADQRLLREAVPEKRLRAYDVRRVIDLLADVDSVLELRRAFAPGIISALIRIGGRPMGLLANNPAHLAGAIDADGADKAARFLQLCDAFDLPVLSLCDTPGIMVGPEAESEALVRHASRLFLAAGSLGVPVFTLVLRKGYGLGAMAMAAGGFHAPVFTVAWPTGEFGAMGLEGAVSTGFQKELAELKDWNERQRYFEQLVDEAYEQGKALNMATYLEIDDVIDPAQSRDWILRGLASLPPVVGWAARTSRKRMIDAW
ncbi:MAG: carboxyl transferase domain-containing protein, partial [Leptospirales bacterium]